MSIYDKRDIKMIANVINNLGPKNECFRARMVIEACVEAGIGLDDIHAALDWYIVVSAKHFLNTGEMI